MATTKELLEKAMLRLGSRGARCRGEATSFSVDQDSTETQRFVAPEDGYVIAQGLSSVWSYCRIVLTTSSSLTYMPVSGSGVAMACSAFVTKGETFSVAYKEVTNRALLFIKSIGGGLRSLAETLWRSGGELWLRLKNYFRPLSIRELGRLCQRAHRLQSHTLLSLTAGAFGTRTKTRPIRPLQTVGLSITQLVAHNVGSLKMVASPHRWARTPTTNGRDMCLLERALLFASVSKRENQGAQRCGCPSDRACNRSFALGGI